MPALKNPEAKRPLSRAKLVSGPDSRRWPRKAQTPPRAGPQPRRSQPLHPHPGGTCND